MTIVENVAVVRRSASGVEVQDAATRELADAINNLLEYWDHGTAVHASSIVVADFRNALENARKEA